MGSEPGARGSQRSSAAKPVVACATWACALALAACGGQGSAASATQDGHDGGSIADAGGGGGEGGFGKDGAGSSPDAPGPGKDAAAGDGGAASGSDASSSVPRKRGLAYGSSSTADLTALSAGIAWWYNWSPQPDSSLGATGAPPGVEFVPMIWGGTFDPATLAKQVPAGAAYLLTFNEPNFGSQSNLTPQQAAALWPQIEAFAKPRGMKIVSPALNYCGGNCNETNPFTWLDAFFAACTGCQVD
jgi:hypothetical protein